MGQRANLIVISGGSVEVYYTHHRANTLEKDLFWGPDYSLGFIRMQQRVPDRRLLDDVWAEGGAVLDIDSKVLLWFGGEDIMYEVGLRRLHQKLMAALWPGWELRWAHEGVVEIAGYIGLPKDHVLTAQKSPASASRTDVARAVTPGSHEYFRTVCAIRTTDDLVASALDEDCTDLLYIGDSLVDAALAAGWGASLDLSKNDFPTGGIYVDAAQKQLEFWATLPMSTGDIEARAQHYWPGWTVRWHRDRFEFLSERLGAKLIVPPENDAAHLDRLRQMLLRPNSTKSGAETIVEVAALLTGDRSIDQVKINPSALHDARLILPVELRTQLFAEAVASLTKQGGV